MEEKTLQAKYWVILPAAGIGKRFGSSTPKQYAKIGEQTIMEITINKLLKWPHLAGIVVAINDKDDLWHELEISRNRRVVTVVGGYSRIESVHSGLEYLADKLDASDLVLVHDIVRPCVLLSDIYNLLEKVVNRGAVGGLLAYPVVDTLKKSDSDNSIIKTLSRRHVWQAATPQVFPLKALRDALETSQDDESITDEASSIEKLGFTPLLVESSKHNIKITTVDDLELASYILKAQHAI